jgi:hypothetical protein
MLNGCVTQPAREFCASFRPIIVHCDPESCAKCAPGLDCITDRTAQQIVAANNTWKRLCR